MTGREEEETAVATEVATVARDGDARVGPVWADDPTTAAVAAATGAPSWKFWWDLASRRGNNRWNFDNWSGRSVRTVPWHTTEDIISPERE